MKDAICKCGHEADMHYNGNLGCRVCKCKTSSMDIYNARIAELRSMLSDLVEHRGMINYDSVIWAEAIAVLKQTAESEKS